MHTHARLLTSIQSADAAAHCAATATPFLLNTFTSPSPLPGLARRLDHWGSLATSSGVGPPCRLALAAATASAAASRVARLAARAGSRVQSRTTPSLQPVAKSPSSGKAQQHHTPSGCSTTSQPPLPPLPEDEPSGTDHTAAEQSSEIDTNPCGLLLLDNKGAAP